MNVNIGEMVGRPVYQCCRCGLGAIDLDGPMVPFGVLAVFAQGLHVSEVDGVPRLIVHACHYGGAGLAILSGMESEEAVQVAKKRRQQIQEARAVEGASAN